MRQPSADRLALPAGLVVTLSVLGVVFYYPVSRVLLAAIDPGGAFFGPIRTILADPFYVGVGHHAFADPLGVPSGVLAWIRNGVPLSAVEFGLFGFTAYQAGLSALASVALGLPGAYVLARYEFRGRETLRSLTIVPFVLPSILVAVGFQAMFGQTGVLNDVLAAMGFERIEFLFSLPIVIVAHAFYNAPLVTRLVTAAWEGIDAQQIESARAMGASPLRAFRDVVAPQLRPSVLTAGLLAFIFSFMSFPIVLALGGLELQTVEVWLYAKVQSLALEEAAALAVLETLISLGLMYLYLRYEAAQVVTRSGGTTQSRRPLVAGARTLTDPHRLAVFAYGIVAAVVFLGPVVSLILESITGPGGEFTLAYYEFLLAQQASAAVGTIKPLPAIGNSLLFAVGTLALAVPMGVIVSIIATGEGRGGRLAEAVLSAPIAVSGIVVGLGLLQTLVFGVPVFGHRLTVTGPVAVVAAHAVAAYPFVSRTVTPALAGLDDRLAEAARSLGASRVRALVTVTVPLIVPALLAGAAFAFAISIGEFDSTVLLSEGGGSYTMPVALERYVGNRSLGPSLGAATAMGTVLLTVTAISFVVIDRVGGRYDG
ncbi:iron ABC transporter permease [Halorhabdus sp. BNX81]|uniref:ABC transporter permease n=1 Tax=Halorhabdus sp. BNX81 TaxID=2980181 RepID=UPI0023DD5992|nr:iron ABC transporter permease [Halorhabdus sp. BNX81]WEL21242.1 ABC-type thiamine transport system, permease component [Halorhabdus sp. BNX81]